MLRKKQLTELKEQILYSRRKGVGGDKVVYDLRDIMGNYDDRTLAKIFATVFFENEVSKWFVGQGRVLRFKPENKAEVIVSGNKGEQFIEMFRIFLTDNEMRIGFATYILESARRKLADPNDLLPDSPELDFKVDQNRLERMVEYQKALLKKVDDNTTYTYS